MTHPFLSPEQATVLITGCSSGIGRCVAELLQARGYRVFATARRQEDVVALQEQGFLAYRLDLSDESSIEEAVEWVLQQSGGQLYALFNNGAYGLPGAVEDISLAALRAQFETNLFGTHALTCRVIPIMRRQGYGRIIQNSSILGFVALKYRGAYIASKYALEGLSDTLRLELQGSGIHVALIEPGPVISRFRENAAAAFERWVAEVPSVHALAYQGLQAARLSGKRTTFSVTPEAVYKRVLHVLESKRPRERYPVTFPTYLFAFLKRLLPTGWMDRILASKMM
ncbi:SDR family oxidoreductase [Candidatus Magnetaquicoccus inordinatus]|uniref:SDR family oxidoreductase n=1 Tax=Candidatus Magnetaquicoccus inordinatus TaxID=2496818 RepID=UPI00102AF549|nr:SDR family oxidoreductase [Candidatus Magnetaquicoccus inordinatus]